MQELLLENALNKQNILINDKQKSQIVDYLNMLGQWNKIYNLTAITCFDKMVNYHIIDSLSVLEYVGGKPTLDFGSGAGLPGVPLAIMHSNQEFTLLDSNGKKCRFLRHVARELKLHNIEVINDRIESLAKKQTFPQIICRAVSNLSNLVRFCMPVCAEGGRILCMKGAVKPTNVLKNYAQEIIPLKVPAELGERNLICISRSIA